VLLRSLVPLLLPSLALAAEPIDADYVLRGGLVIDGTGAPGQKADVAIRGRRIVAVGQFEATPRARTINAAERVIAPGFIDLHSHSDGPIVRDGTRANRNYLTQGVTTVVTGNCGSGPIDAKTFFATIDKEGAGTNVILLVGHGSVRRKVMGNGEKQADEAALKEMSALVDRAMQDGAWGLSTGLIYLPGRYADTDELVALSKVVARHGGFYASHIRDEGAGLLGSIEDALEIGRRAKVPVHISHLKATGRKNWGLVEPACAKIAEARAAGLIVTADQYPYVASSTQLSAMVVPHWARQGGKEEFIRLADDPESGPKLRAEIDEELRDRDGGASVRIAR
jgi:N-acyl-D-aspartate/D-glutamate deacylase